MEALGKLFDKKNYEDLFKHKCFRSSYGWGAVTGGLMLAHKIKTYQGNHLRRAFLWGFGVFIVISGFNFNICISEEYKRMIMTQQRMRAAGMGQVYKAPSPEPSEIKGNSGNGNNSSSSSSNS